MMDLRTMTTAEGLILWVRLSGEWCGQTFDALHQRIAGMGLPSQSQVILDFMEIDHIDFRTVAHLLELAQSVEDQSLRLRVVGLGPYLGRIIAFGGGIDGRDFLERYAPMTVAGVQAAPAGTASRDDRTLASGRFQADAQVVASRLRRHVLRRTTLGVFAAMAEPSPN